MPILKLYSSFSNFSNDLSVSLKFENQIVNLLWFTQDISVEIYLDSSYQFLVPLIIFYFTFLYFLVY